MEEEHNPSGYKPKAQYKSAIWPTNQAQEALAQASKMAIQDKYGVVHTDIDPPREWHDAEEYHQVRTRAHLSHTRAHALFVHAHPRTRTVRTRASRTRASRTRASRTRASHTRASRTRASRTRASRTRASRTCLYACAPLFLLHASTRRCSEVPVPCFCFSRSLSTRSRLSCEGTLRGTEKMFVTPMCFTCAWATIVQP
jgi:hypothetical protein